MDSLTLDTGSHEPPEIPLGRSMPDLDRIPTLLPQQQTVSLARAEPVARHSMLARGLSFVGTARIDGSLTVAGDVQGDLGVVDGSPGQVTVTETGAVNGDIRARHIAVLGRTTGLLDAAGGRVSLHDTASVSGHIRYTHLQVNGADLNAQLERVRPEPDSHGPR